MRLIDADAFRKKMYHEAFETDSDMQKWDSGCWIRYKLFEKAIEEVPTIEQERWIPVTERLPEYGTNVLTIHKDGEYQINDVIDEEDGTWFWDGVVAWMPLPEAYTKGE